MNDSNKTKEQLISELEEMRQRISELETKDQEPNQIKELINASTDIIGLLDTNGILLITNKVTAARVGRPQIELLGTSIWDLFPPKLVKSRKDQFDYVVRTGQPKRFEDENNGIWFDNYFYPLIDSNRTITNIAVIARDITARKQVEEERERLIVELQEALERVNTLHGLLPMCAWCKKLRDDQGYWKSVEEYLSGQTGTEFTHAICEECMSIYLSDSSTQEENKV